MELREQIACYRPVNAQEEKDKELLLAWLDSGIDLYSRDCAAAHLTASAWVVSPDRKKVLMAYHKIYNSWAWTGGHADGERDLCNVARREAMEESGITELKLLDPGIFSLEILSVDGHEKRGQYVSSHLHLNLTYLFEADPNAPIHHKPDENKAVAWFDTGEVLKKSTEPWFCQRIYSKLMDKVRRL